MLRLRSKCGSRNKTPVYLLHRQHGRNRFWVPSLRARHPGPSRLATDDVHWASAGCTDATNPACYDAHPDFLQTPIQGQFGDFGFYFNGASSRFTRSQEAPGGAANGPFWGCDWNDGLTSTSFTVNKQTYTSQCGIYQRQAFGHLFDRATFSANRELANLVCPSPVAKDPSCAPLQVGQDGLTVAQQCAWDTLNGGSACIDAYRIAPSGGDGQQPVGSPDFCRAADLMIASLTPGTQDRKSTRLNSSHRCISYAVFCL